VNIEKALRGSPLGFRVKPNMRFHQKGEHFLILDSTCQNASAVHPFIEDLYVLLEPQVFVSDERRILRAFNIPLVNIYSGVYRNLLKLSRDSVPADLFHYKYTLKGEDFPYLDFRDVTPECDNFQTD